MTLFELIASQALSPHTFEVRVQHMSLGGKGHHSVCNSLLIFLSKYPFLISFKNICIQGNIRTISFWKISPDFALPFLVFILLLYLVLLSSFETSTLFVSFPLSWQCLHFFHSSFIRYLLCIFLRMMLFRIFPIFLLFFWLCFLWGHFSVCPSFCRSLLLILSFRAVGILSSAGDA